MPLLHVECVPPSSKELLFLDTLMLFLGYGSSNHQLPREQELRGHTCIRGNHPSRSDICARQSGNAGHILPFTPCSSPGLSLLRGLCAHSGVEPSRPLIDSAPLGSATWAPSLPAGTLDVLRQPPDAFTVALSHDDRAHEDLDGSDISERDLALCVSSAPALNLRQCPPCRSSGTARADA